MTEPTQKTKKISRRDAIKLLGAVTGATVLANLPSKWSTPELASGVLPAHAQTSSSLLSILSCGGDVNCQPLGVLTSSAATISQALGGVSMNYVITNNTGGIIEVDGVAQIGAIIPGTASTNASGVAGIDLTFFSSNGPAIVVWSFVVPSQGSGTCVQFFLWNNCGS